MWQVNAQCARHPDPDMWFSPAGTIEHSTAVRICRSCSVRRDCAHQGITEPYGIWGGFDQDTLDFLRGYRQPDIVTKQLLDAQLARV